MSDLIVYFYLKAFDDALRKKGEAEGNKREINKYSPESEHSTFRMNDLIQRVQQTQSKVKKKFFSYFDSFFYHKADGNNFKYRIFLFPSSLNFLSILMKN